MAEQAIKFVSQINWFTLGEQVFPLVLGRVLGTQQAPLNTAVTGTNFCRNRGMNVNGKLDKEVDVQKIR